MWTDEQRETFRTLCGIFCDRDEVCAVMRVDAADLDREVAEAFPDTPTFDAAFRRYSAEGRANLRRAQYKAACDGNIQMLTWLGRAYLGQESAAYKPKQSRADKAKAEDATPPASDALASLRTRLKVVGGD
jgi:hypothetical protein